MVAAEFISDFYGPVSIRLRNGKFTTGTLLSFCTIPVPSRGESDVDMRVFVYAICETDEGSFVARSLQEIKRTKGD